eukprot:CAMPEP_0185844336 /NCGR_PEP_ID=MMETSP1354-20130828/539_1 /TAXON_ID=708628 /ORGANISM="Erythrolobus madagascarensis, Strain CCMP3276" /LENGTH=116 /DNA_ID=CAMNT_0028543983 /DNA_START=204 /DNA_END=554 /DNA_ORIENTATION=+
MVNTAIKEIGDRTGSSVPAISKFIGEQYKVEVNKQALSKAVKKGVEDGTLVRIKASYKLSPKAAAKASKTKKAAPKKAAPKKTATKKASTKKAAPKKTSSSKPKKTIKKKTAAKKK